MKNLSKIPFLVLLLFVSVIASSSASKKSEKVILTLSQAIKDGKIKATPASNGEYSGFCVDLFLQNMTPSAIEIVIPGGTKYHPSDDEEQTLIQLDDKNILVNAKGTSTVKIPAYCMEASNRCPTTKGIFRMTQNQQPKFEALIAYIKNKPIDRRTFQEAVWAISDQHSVSNMVAENDATTEFRKYIAELTGQKNEWFTSPQSVQVDQDGNFNYSTVNISGELAFDCKKGSNIYQDVHKESGEVFFEDTKSFSPQSDHLRYQFKLSVTGWEKGNYYINIHDGTKQLAKFDYKV